jgi:hypothetical protein
MLTSELLSFLDAYVSGAPIVDAYVEAHPDAAAYSRPEAHAAAMAAFYSDDAQEYIGFLRHERQTTGAVPLKDHLFDLGELGRVGDDMMKRMLSRGNGSSDSSAASVYAQRIRVEELKGKASGHYAQRTEFGVSPDMKGNGKFRVDVEWAD